jgi:glycosyltransferase involved in cell wall biosynthesis
VTATVDKVKVLLMTDDLRPGGAERQLVELAKGLDKERFRVLVMTLYPGQPLERELEGQEGIRLLSLNRKGKFDFGILLPLVRLLRREEVHVIQPFLSPATFFGLTAALLARVPVKVVTERCGVRRNTKFGENLYRFVEDRLTRFADVAVANSQSGAHFLASRGISAEKTRVIYNGVNSERVAANEVELAALRASLGIPAAALVVGIVASLTAAKDYPTFLSSARIVLDALPSARFLIVGDGPLRQELEATAAQLGLADSVLFAGHQMRVAPFIGSFDVAVLSSCDYEGCSNYLLEAMGLGRPVVATDIGGNRELVHQGETGLLVPPRDPGALASAVLTLLGDRALASRLVDAARTRFQAGFSVPTMVRQYEQLYEELLQKKGVRLPLARPSPAHLDVSRKMAAGVSTGEEGSE